MRFYLYLCVLEYKSGNGKENFKLSNYNNLNVGVILRICSE